MRNPPIPYFNKQGRMITTIQVEEILHDIDLDSPSVCVTRLINILFNTLELYESMGILSQHVTKVC